MSEGKSFNKYCLKHLNKNSEFLLYVNDAQVFGMCGYCSVKLIEIGFKHKELEI